MPKIASMKRMSREQRRRNREGTFRADPGLMDSATPALTEPALVQSNAAAKARDATMPQAFVRTGLMKRLLGAGNRRDSTVLVKLDQKPSVLRPFARRAYQRDATLHSIQRGFNELAQMMGEIRTGLSDSIEKQAELVNELKHLPAIAKQNTESILRFEEQFTQNNHQLARSNEIAGSNLKLQGDALRHQAESVWALKEQIRGQADQNAQLSKLFSSMGRDTRDHSRDIDELQGRLDRMRESDAVIANNLGSVAGAIRHVSEQAAIQGQLLARLTQSIDDRTQRRDEKATGKKRGFGWLKAA